MPHLYHYLSEYGYLALFLVILVEGFGIPAPGQTFLIASALLAVKGRLNIGGVLATAFLAAAIGNSIGYWIGKRGGRQLLLRFGRYVHFGETELGRLETYFTRYGAWFVILARFFEVLRQLNGVVAGMAGMPLGRFVPANLLGATLWVGIWGLGSWKLGREMRDYENLFEQASTLMVILLVGVLLVLLAALFLRRRWQNRNKTGP
jgi:membrane protein DedA with SNARE-associated domain